MRLDMLRKYWGERAVRLPCVLLTFGAAVALQYYVSKVPAVVDFSNKKEVNPAVVELGQKELVLDHPNTGPSQTLLVSHDGRSDEVVDAHFENARLSEETLRMLAIRGYRDVPKDPAGIDYVTEAEQEPNKETPCRTSIAIGLPSPGAPIGALAFYQLESPDVDSGRHIEIRSGDCLLVHIGTMIPQDSVPTARGCLKMLAIGNWQDKIYAPFPLQIVTEAGAAFRFRFAPTTPASPPWATTDGLLELDLGSPLSPMNSRPFEARGVQVNSRNPFRNQPSLITALAMDGDAPLVFSRLKIGSDQLQIQVAGRGRFSTNGQPEAMDLLGLAGRYPLVAGLITTANGALLTWLIRVATTRPKPRKKSRRSTNRSKSHKRTTV